MCMQPANLRSLSACLVAGAVLIGAAAAHDDKPATLPGEKFTPPAQNERHQDKLKPGDAAPDFSLPDPAGKNETKLSSFKDKKPVVLIFGSCT